MTNYEHMKTLSLEETANIMYDLSNCGEYCPVPTGYLVTYRCDEYEGLCSKQCVVDWLREEWQGEPVKGDENGKQN